VTISVRPAAAGDTPAILALLGRLAEFEREPGAVTVSAETIAADGFGQRFRTLLAEEGGRTIGLANLLTAYSSWKGAPTLVIHDLFVDDDARGAGAGHALLAAAARLARDEGCCRIDVNVLAWNAPARSFYQSLGFAPLRDWMPYRLDADGVERLAASSVRDAR